MDGFAGVEADSIINEMVVQFTSDSSVTRNGFHASWIAIDGKLQYFCTVNLEMALYTKNILP